MQEKIKWLKAKCPICGCEYGYLSNYKPATCSKFECIHKFLHPDVYQVKRESGK